MKEGAGSLFLGSLVYGLGLSIGLALAGCVLFYAGLKIWGWYNDHQDQKAEKRSFDEAMRKIVLEQSQRRTQDKGASQD